MVTGMPVSTQDGGAEAQSGIPQGEGFVGRAGEEEVGGGQEEHTVDGGGVATQREATALAVQVPQLGGSVRRAGSKEVTARVEGAAPGWLAVAGEYQHAAAKREIPEAYLQEGNRKSRCHVRRSRPL